MIKRIVKTIFTIILCSTAFLAKAQLGYDYAQYDVGVAVGASSGISTDVASLRNAPSLHFNFNYNSTPFVNYVFEMQVGRLKGGDSTKTAGGGREFENHFTAFLFRAQLQAGELFDYSQGGVGNAFKNFYVSTGIGYIVNHIVAKSADIRVTSGRALPGDNNSQIPFIPARIGYEFKIFNDYNQPSVKVDIGYQYNFMFDDNLDGYKTGAKNDVMGQLTLGVKFAIGGVTSYRKQINY
jgi:hypothetical protein